MWWTKMIIFQEGDDGDEESTWMVADQSKQKHKRQNLYIIHKWKWTSIRIENWIDRCKIYLFFYKKNIFHSVSDDEMSFWLLAYWQGVNTWRYDFLWGYFFGSCRWYNGRDEANKRESCSDLWRLVASNRPTGPMVLPYSNKESRSLSSKTSLVR